MVFTVRLDEKTSMLIKEYCDTLEVSVSDFIKKAMVEKADRDIEIDMFQDSLREYKENNRVYSISEIQNILWQNGSDML